MPKDIGANSSSFGHARPSPYSRCSKISDGNKFRNSLRPVGGDETEWEEARCPICMDHPHNAVLLICSSWERGCRPFMCDTSYRHSNCLDQFRKSSVAAGEQHHRPVCPLCRGLVTGSDVIEEARVFMDSKKRNCSLETCGFSGNYAELRKHARVEHPYDRPSEASPTRKSNWAALEREGDLHDVLAFDTFGFDLDFDWAETPTWDAMSDFLTDESFFDFPSGTSGFEYDEGEDMFDVSFPMEEVLDLFSTRTSDGHTGANSSNSSSRGNNVGVSLPSSRSRSWYQGQNGPSSLRSGSTYHTNRESSFRTFSRSRLSNNRNNAVTSPRARSLRHMEDALQVQEVGLSYHEGPTTVVSWILSDGPEVVPTVRRHTATRDFPPQR